MNRHIFRMILMVSVSFFLSIPSFSQSLSSLESSTEVILKASQIGGKKLNTTELSTLVKSAKIRLQDMQANLDQPNSFIKLLLPHKITRSLPREVQPYLEQEVADIEGTIEIRAAMYADNHKEAMQYLLHQNNEIYYLHFSDVPPTELQTDARVRINQAFLIPTTTQAKQIVLSSHDVTILRHVTALPLSFGPQSTITMLVNFTDNQTKQVSLDDIKKLMYTNVNNYYQEASYNQTSIVGQALDWVTLAMPSTTACADLPNMIESLADQAAKNAGVDVTQYKRKVYFFPKTSSCTWTGLGTVGGTNTRAFMNGAMTTIKTVSHEMGHNIGLRHAQALRCPTSPIGDGCPVSEYGDGSDTMGNTNAGHFNAFQKDRLGWLNYQASPPITTVTQSGSYFIDVYETANNRPKALKVLKRAGGSDYYYLEFRQGVGNDSVLESCGTSCDFTKGILFHQGNPSTSSSPQLLDMTPGSGNSLVTLLPCKSWSDPGAPNGGVTFTVQSISKQGARVQVTYGGLTEKCQRQSPTVTVLPSYTPWMNMGESGTYTVAIKNNDNHKCDARTFTLVTPANNAFVTMKTNHNTVKVLPGKTQIMSVSIASTYAGAPFIYSNNVMMQDNAGSQPIMIPMNIGLYKS